MVKNFLSWLGAIFAEYTVLQLIAAVPLAYFLDLASVVRREGNVVFDSLSPFFWPILATLVLVVTFYPAFVVPFVEWRGAKERTLRASIEDAYIKFRNACEPDTLDPKHPGNPAFMAADARDYANLIRLLIQDARLHPPGICTTEPSSLNEWFVYLGQVRAMPRWTELTYRAQKGT